VRTSIRVIIADDHQMMLEGLAQALSAIPDIEIIATATDGEALLEALAADRPDVLLVDVEMPNLGGIAALAALDEPPPTLIVTMHTDDEYRRRAAKAGAVGFLSKASPLPDLAAAIRAADSGVDLMEVTDLDTALAAYRQPRLSAAEASLTDREREILTLLAQGMSRTEDLAEVLFISQKTVKNHLASIYEKLGVSDRAQLVVEAMRLGLR
jgi:DNA-binding NarL/FixJ family response regulator